MWIVNLGLWSVLMTVAASQAHAYVDPGTGFTFVTGFWAIVAGAFGVLVGILVLAYKKILKWIDKILYRVTNA